MIKRIKAITGLDFHVLSTLLLRSWGIMAGAVTLIMLPAWLSPAQQGYYYTFASLLALQIFFELGFSQVIVMLVSHEAAHLSLDQNGTHQGDPDRIARLAGIVALLRQWYCVAAVLFVLIAGAAGWLFFSTHDQTLPMSTWAPVWGVVVVLSAINLYVSPQLAVIEGLGQVGQVARLRLIQSIGGYASLWLLLILDAQLWAIIAIPLIAAMATLWWLRTRMGWFKSVPAVTSCISWRREIFPIQWRIAVSWISGYFIFNLFTPIVFSSHGAVEAGRLGMALQVFNAVSTLGLSWINAKVPNFTMHISRGETTALNQLFKSVALRSVIATMALCFVVLGMVTLGSVLEIDAMNRIASPNVLLWLACATIINTLIYAAASYMRAHREEPMLTISIITALLTVAVLLLLQTHVSHMMMGYAMICFFISLPWTAWIFQRFRLRHNSLPHYLRNTI